MTGAPGSQAPPMGPPSTSHICLVKNVFKFHHTQTSRDNSTMDPPPWIPTSRDNSTMDPPPWTPLRGPPSMDPLPWTPLPGPPSLDLAGPPFPDPHPSKKILDGGPKKRGQTDSPNRVTQLSRYWYNDPGCWHNLLEKISIRMFFIGKQIGFCKKF